MDTIANMLTGIRNAGAALLPRVRAPHSRIKEGVVRILQREGYIAGYRVSGGIRKEIEMTLRYRDRRSVISGIERVSRPGLRHYVGSGEIPRVLGGMGVTILSTSRGVMSGRDARRRNIGGEVICNVW